MSEPTTAAERREQARIRAHAATSHFGTSSSCLGSAEVKCDRCRLPLNRWEEPCDYAKTAEALLAEDVLWLLDQSVKP